MDMTNIGICVRMQEKLIYFTAIIHFLLDLIFFVRLVRISRVHAYVPLLGQQYSGLIYILLNDNCVKFSHKPTKFGKKPSCIATWSLL